MTSTIKKSNNLIGISGWGNFANVGQTIALTRDITQASTVILRAGWNVETSGYADAVISFKPEVGQYWQVLYHVGNDICYVTVHVTNATTLTVKASNNTSLGIRQVYAIY